MAASFWKVTMNSVTNIWLISVLFIAMALKERPRSCHLKVIDIHFTWTGVEARSAYSNAQSRTVRPKNVQIFTFLFILGSFSLANIL